MRTVHSVGEENFEWIVDKVAELAVKKAQTPASDAGVALVELSGRRGRVQEGSAKKLRRRRVPAKKSCGEEAIAKKAREEA